MVDGFFWLRLVNPKEHLITSQGKGSSRADLLLNLPLDFYETAYIRHVSTSRPTACICFFHFEGHLAIRFISFIHSFIQ